MVALVKQLFLTAWPKFFMYLHSVTTEFI